MTEPHLEHRPSMTDPPNTDPLEPASGDGTPEAARAHEGSNARPLAPERQQIFATAVAFEAGLGVVAIVLGWLLAIEPRPLAQIGWSIEAFAIGLAATVPLLAGFWAAVRWPVGPLEEIERIVRTLVVPLFRQCSLVELLLISAAAGLGEELLFRGVAQRAVIGWSGSPWLGIVAAALLFGLAHPITRAYIVLAAAIGVYLGWLTHATGNLLPAITAHAAYDFVALLYLVRKGGKG